MMKTFSRWYLILSTLLWVSGSANAQLGEGTQGFLVDIFEVDLDFSGNAVRCATEGLAVHVRNAAETYFTTYLSTDCGFSPIAVFIGGKDCVSRDPSVLIYGGLVTFPNTATINSEDLNTCMRMAMESPEFADIIRNISHEYTTLTSISYRGPGTSAPVPPPQTLAPTTETPTFFVEPSMSPSATKSNTPSVTSSNKPSMTVSSSPSSTKSSAPTVTASNKPSPTVSSSPSATVSISPTVTNSNKPSATVSSSPTATVSNKPSPTVSSSPSMAVSTSPTVTGSNTPSVTVSSNPTVTTSSKPTIAGSSSPTVASSETPSKAPVLSVSSEAPSTSLLSTTAPSVAPVIDLVTSTESPVSFSSSTSPSRTPIASDEGDGTKQGGEDDQNESSTQSSSIARGPDAASITNSPASSSGSGGFGGSMMMVIAAVLGGVAILIVVLLLAFRNRRKKEREMAMTISPKSTYDDGYDMEEAMSESACSGLYIKPAPSQAGSKVSSKGSAKYSDSTGSLSRSTGLERLLATNAAVRSLLGLGPELLESGTRGSGETPETGKNSYEDENDDSEADLISLGDLAKEPEVFPLPSQQVLRPTMTALRSQSVRPKNSGRTPTNNITRSKSATIMSPSRRADPGLTRGRNGETDPGFDMRPIAPSSRPAFNTSSHTTHSRSLFSPEVDYILNDLASEDEHSMDQSWHQDQAWNPDDNELSNVPQAGTFGRGTSARK